MVGIPKNNDDFIAKFPLFKYHRKYSPPLRKQINKMLSGLALPCLKPRGFVPWGYKPHPTVAHVIIPIESDLRYFAQAQVMSASKEFYYDDIINWLNSCPLVSAKLAETTYYYNIRNNPLFPESLQPWENRVRLVYDGFAGKFITYATVAHQKKIHARYRSRKE